MVDNSHRPHQSAPVNEGHIEQVIRYQYLERRHSDQEIAAALGVNRVTVTKWRKRWGIAREDRPGVEIPA